MRFTERLQTFESLMAPGSTKHAPRSAKQFKVQHLILVLSLTLSRYLGSA